MPLNPGVIYASSAFVIWGLFPLYFRLMASVSPLEVILHRSVWSLLFLAAVLAVMRRWSWLREVLRDPRQLGTFALSAMLVAVNWLVYIYAVNSGQVVEASLGYFINPLFNVLIGVVLLGERLRRPQWVAVALAGAGVAWLAVAMGRPPWIALALAGSFGLYGLVRKTAKLGSLEGLAFETGLLSLVAVPALAWWTVAQDGALLRGDWALVGWLLTLGPVTAVPLLLFTAGARRLPLSTVGLLQYIGPTLQFGIGVWVFGEAFDAARLAGFAVIWAALAVYTLDALRGRASA